MHDREDPGLAEIRLLDLAVVGIELDDIGLAALERLGRMGRHDRVDIAREQHFGKRALGLRAVADAVGQLERHLFDPSGLADAGLDPLDVLQRDSDLVDQPAAGVDRGGLRPFRDADALAGEAGGVLDRAVGEHEQRRLAEHTGWEHRDPGDGVVVLRDQRDVLPHRHLRNIPFAELGEAEERLLDRQLEGVEVDALDRDIAVCEIADMVVIARREGEPKSGHARRPYCSNWLFDAQGAMRLPACPTNLGHGFREISEGFGDREDGGAG